MVHLGVLFQSAEVHKKFLQVFLRNPAARVLHSDLKVDVALLASVVYEVPSVGPLSIFACLCSRVN